MMNSIHDPFGIGFPIFVRRQKHHTDVVSQLAWGDPVDEGIQEKWVKWKCNLNMLKDIKLRRCYEPEGFGQVVSCS